MTFIPTIDSEVSRDYTTVEYSVTNRVATITLNRPEAMNAINEAMRNDTYHAVKAAIADASVGAIVIAANGKGFSAGTDLQELSNKPDIYSLLEDEYRPILQALLDSPKPVIASVRGACAGVGASLALACDLMIMGESAFIYLAFAAIGLIPDGGMCWYLARNMGYRRAYQVIAEAGRITAEQCVDYGLANKVVADGELAESTQVWAEKLCKAAPFSLRYSKHILQQAITAELSDIMRLEAGLQQVCSKTEDNREGVSAFFEKRKPVFTGK